MSRVMSVRVNDASAEWVARYAESAGVKRQVWLENAVESFIEVCKSGTPELRSFRDEEATPAESPVEAVPSPRRQQAARVLLEVQRGPHVNERQAKLNAAKYGGGS
jgi:hypothetical protein